MGDWTFGRKLGTGFAITVALTLLVGTLAVVALRNVVAAKDGVISGAAQNIADAERMSGFSARRGTALRGYLLSDEEKDLQEMRDRRADFVAVLQRLRANLRRAEAKRLLEEIAVKEVIYDRASEDIAALRHKDEAMEVIIARFTDDLAPKRETLRTSIDALLSHEQHVLDEEKEAATASANAAITLVLFLVGIIVAFSIGIAVLLTRTLSRQIGTSVGQVQSSSAELQAAASQQASAAKEQATAIAEITTTITELLTTSRQIAESAQRVAHIANETAGAARSGDTTVARANEALASIRRQVDQIVNQMLELGKKSQTIGSVLDIVGELAEQTNILAINATIEAAGAGEHGKRFAVVADEIRKLADRVAGATREIRSLIEDVRGSANATVMTTETGAKAVDAGAKQFAEVTGAFRHIGGLVGTTTESAREIELSTKQQATAMEQVKVAITNVAQASKETATSTTQTLQTASQLSGLSRDLLRLVRPQSSIGDAGRAA